MVGPHCKDARLEKIMTEKRGPGRPRGSDRTRAWMRLSSDVHALLDAYQAALGLPTKTAAVERLVRQHAAREIKTVRARMLREAAGSPDGHVAS
ncbi:MAG: hypothetical protein ACRCZI_05870 [Cetobacterium sp.]